MRTINHSDTRPAYAEVALCWHMTLNLKGEIGADDAIRTRDPDLGKVVLYP